MFHTSCKPLQKPASLVTSTISEECPAKQNLNSFPEPRNYLHLKSLLVILLVICLTFAIGILIFF